MRDAQGYLWDIKDAADAINRFVKDIDRVHYAENELIHSAVERKFEIIGEALNLLSKADPKLAALIPEYQRIIAFRNVLIHGYEAVEHNRVWDIIKDFLPDLLAVIDKLLHGE